MSNIRFIIAVGQHIELDGRILRFRNRGADAKRRMVFEGVDGVPADMTDDEFLKAQMSERLRLLTPDEVAALQTAPDRPRIVMADQIQEACESSRRSLDYIRAWERAGSPARNNVNLGRIGQLEFERRRGELRVGDRTQEIQAPGVRTIQRWIAEWLKSGGDIEALVSQRGNSGNHDSKLSPRVRNIVDDVVAEAYLVDTSPPVVTVYNKVVAAVCEHNAALPAADHLLVPCRDTVYRAVENLDPYTVEFCRKGKLAAEKRWRPVQSAPEAEKHNEAWEIDHTPVDLIVVDDMSGLPIGRPYVTVAIDRFSRMCMGFQISFEPPGVTAVMDCLRHAILPKPEPAEGVGANGCWPAFGTPEVLVTDQGREFKSLSFRDACLTLGIDVQYTPVLKAWYKGTIERFIKNLAVNVFHHVPGTTFSNIFERKKERTPERIAVATLAELREHVVRYLVDIYQHRRHRGLFNKSPRQVWDSSVALHGMRPMPSPERIRSALSHMYYRKPQRSGIEVVGLLYQSTEVARFRISARREDSVRVLIDPYDLTQVTFMDPNTKLYHKVPIQPRLRKLVEGVSLHKHLLARAMQRASPEVFGDKDGLARCYVVLDRAMTEKGEQSGLKNRAAAARYFQSMSKVRPGDDAPAFDVGKSASPLLDGILDISVDDDNVGGAEFQDGDCCDEAPLEAAAEVVAPDPAPKSKGRPKGASTDSKADKKADAKAKPELPPGPKDSWDDIDFLEDVEKRLGLKSSKSGENSGEQ